jgi:hypothetical protein
MCLCTLRYSLRKGACSAPLKDLANPRAEERVPPALSHLTRPAESDDSSSPSLPFLLRTQMLLPQH